ncbi:MAG: hypothetical protein V4616_06460 [Bacteroidota bacterium]
MITLSSIVSLLRPASVIGTAEKDILNVIPFNPDNTDETAISWVNEKNLEKLYSCRHGVVIAPATTESERIQPGCTVLTFDSPRNAFRELLVRFFEPQEEEELVSPTAVIGRDVKMGSRVYIGHGVVIGDNSVIGDDVRILHNTVILRGTVIGSHVRIGSNNTIGGVGFGYEKGEDGNYAYIPHIGNVVIHDHVDIGNNTTIDRAVLGSTVIGENVKIDNLVHIAHGVTIDTNSLIIANAMVGGSTHIGKNVWVAPSSSLINKISIGDDAVVGLAAVVIKNVENGEVVIGNPAKPLQKKNA